MIKSKSPYWIDIPFVSPLSGATCTEYTLELYVWNGLKGSPPAEPIYSITKKNPDLSTGTDRINIANLISDYIDFTAQEGVGTQLIDGNNQYWVKWQTLYTTDDPIDNGTPSNINTFVYTKGYSYGMDGENAPTPANMILMSGTEFKVQRGGKFILPIEIEETPPTPPSLVLNTVTLDTGSDYIYNYTLNYNAPSVSLQFRNVGDLFYFTAFPVTGDGTAGTNEATAEITITGDIEARVTAYDPITNQVLTSNVISFTI